MSNSLPDDKELVGSIGASVEYHPLFTNVITFDYVNWRGEVGKRRAHVVKIVYGCNEHHTEPQWLMHAFDYDKEAVRVFAMKDMTNVRECK